ncbi:MAG: amidohydrolase [Deltaproteobacteria bacterium]|nr:amidohydrolase [Deltaproteobacteria bacterium]
MILANKGQSVAPDISFIGGTALTLNKTNDIIENAQIDILHGRIVSIKSVSKPTQLLAKKIIDASGCLVMPGLINGHTHTGMTLLRGIADDLPLYSWLNDKIFPLEKKWVSKDFVYLGNLLAQLEMIRSGTTIFNDMYYFEAAAAQAVQESGLRAICGQTLVEISGVEDTQKIFAQFDQYLEAIAHFPRVLPAIAPHSIYGVSDPVWEKITQYASERSLRVHLHLQETKSEVEDCQKKRNMTPTEFFEKVGLFRNKTIVAHAVCMEEKDISILSKYQVGVIHNPESNLKLGSLIAPVVKMRDAGVSIGLGTDGTASNNNLDLLEEADTALKLQIFQTGVGKLKALDVVRMLTLEGAKALKLDHEIGSLEVGKSADLIAVNTEFPHAVPLYDPFSHLAYSASGRDVKHSVVGGSVLMENGKVLTLDEKAILQEAKQWGRRIASEIS